MDISPDMPTGTLVVFAQPSPPDAKVKEHRLGFCVSPFQQAQLFATKVMVDGETIHVNDAHNVLHLDMNYIRMKRFAPFYSKTGGSLGSHLTNQRVDESRTSANI